MGGVAHASFGMKTWAQKGGTPKFNLPRGVCCDTGGNIYVADYANHVIRMVTPAGVVTTLAGQHGSPGFTNGTGTAAQFNYPTHIAFYDNNLYVADFVNLAVRQVTLAGVVTTVFTLKGTEQGCSGVAVDASNGNCYAASPGKTDFSDGGSIYKNGTFFSGVSTGAYYNTPTGLAADGAGNLFIAEQGSGYVDKLVLGTGALSNLVQVAGLCNDVCLDGAGNAYAAGQSSDYIALIVVATGAITYYWCGEIRGYANGSGSNAKFDQPHGVGLDGSGNLYVGDTVNQVISKVVFSTATASLLAGTPGVSGWQDS